MTEEKKRDSDLPMPDWNYWCRMHEWDYKDAIALSLNLEPGRVRKRILRNYPSEHWPLERPYQDRSGDFNDRMKLLGRAITSGQLGQHSFDASVRSVQFVEWLKAVKLEYPPELEDKLIEFGQHVTDWRSKCEELESNLEKITAFDKPSTEINNSERTELDGRSEGTALLLISGLLQSAYGFKAHPGDQDFEKALTNVVSDAIDDFEKSGLQRTREIVRKWFLKALTEHPPFRDDDNE